MATHMVTGPLAILKDATGKQRYYYAGTVLPEDLPADEVKRLVATGLVSKVDDPLTAEIDLGAPVVVDDEAPAAPTPAKPSRASAAKADDSK